MRNFLLILLEKVTSPFRWLWKMTTRPFRAIYRFMMTEPTSQPIGDILSSIAQQSEARKALIEHIEKFRGHLLRSVAAIFGVAGIAAIYANQITEFLAAPIGGKEKLQAIELTEGVSVYMKVIFSVAIAVSVIYIAFEFWFYAAPGLTVKERWKSLRLIPLAAVLFWSGVLFTYFIILPPSLYILQNVGNFQSNPTANTYYSLITRLLVWIGLFFEFPLVTTLLTDAGVITPKGLLGQWRIAIIIIAIVAAVITPTTDPGSMAIVMIPMAVLYFISIGLSFLSYRDKQKKAQA